MKIAAFVILPLTILVLTISMIAYMNCRVESEKLETEANSLVPSVAFMVDRYKDHFDTEGVWPNAGYEFDDSMLPYIRTLENNGVRIDTYGTFGMKHEIDFELHSNGEVKAYRHQIK